MVTGDWQSNVAVDKLSVLGGPITSDGSFLAMWAFWVHNLIYTIEGCEDYVGIYVKELTTVLIWLYVLLNQR